MANLGDTCGLPTLVFTLTLPQKDLDRTRIIVEGWYWLLEGFGQNCAFWSNYSPTILGATSTESKVGSLDGNGPQPASYLAQPLCHPWMENTLKPFFVGLLPDQNHTHISSFPTSGKKTTLGPCIPFLTRKKQFGGVLIRQRKELTVLQLE